ncbi:hypothetical protein GGQ92_000632 [Gracilibacillus halotolerans]|uniref:Uncharacterized protein n=1 Tax=Gracilibacillus halotolerans TaxID=74386 RepID=A0A841RKZ4_9BACI|nr:hypothetical protein [Gracilibacillus halotolerans]MBB6511865.1 hypothetical protein [Gracilibacillus halotolerans]
MEVEESNQKYRRTLLFLRVSLLIMLVITLSLFIYGKVNLGNEKEKANKLGEEPYIQPMEMTEREYDIFRAAGTDNTLAYDIYFPNDADLELHLHYWIEHYQNGIQQDNLIENSFILVSGVNKYSFILVESPVYEKTEIVYNTYRASLLGDRKGNQIGAIFSSVPRYPNNLSSFEDLSVRKSIKLNEELILATKIESVDGKVDFTGILDESDPNFQTMLDDADHAYIYKIKIKSK